MNKTYNENEVKIYINGSVLEIEQQIKYLGVILDNKLKCDICEKISQKLSVLSRLRHELHQGQTLYLYKTIIQPHFMYCPSIIYFSRENEIKKLQILQNKCMSQILKADRFTSSDVTLNSLNLMKVNQLIIFRTLIFIFNIIHGLAPQYLSNRIHYNQNTILLTNATKSCSQNALFYKGIKLFNSLPESIKSEDSNTKFQEILKEYFLKKM